VGGGKGDQREVLRTGQELDMGKRKWEKKTNGER